MQLSCVIPVYNEERNLRPLYDRLVTVFEQMDKSFELLLVDDGSTDGTWRSIQELAQSDHRVVGIKLAQNVGQHTALVAGLARASGETVVTLDADLQNPPEEIPRLLEVMEQGYDAVVGVRKGRRDPLLRRFISAIARRNASSLMSVMPTDWGSMFWAYPREVAHRVASMAGKSAFVPGLIRSMGLSVGEVEVRHERRQQGRSSYGILGLLRLYFDLISEQTMVPIQLMSLVGGVLSLIGFALGLIIFVRRFIFGPEVEGVFTVFAFFFVFFGVLLMAVGILGEYVGRIYREVRKGPAYRVQDTVGEKHPVRIAVFAYSDMGYACLEELIRMGEEICCVVTHRDDPQESVWYPSVRDLAFRNAIPVFQPDGVNDPLFVERLHTLAPDLILSFYCRQILGPSLLSLPRVGCVNLHGSLLPRYRGRCPVNWAVIRGERETGVTLHYMVERPDAGDIIAQTTVSIGEEETSYQVHQKQVQAACELLRRELPAIKERRAPRIPQNEAQATTFGRRRPEDGHIDWNRPAEEIHDLIRAVSHPYPGAYTEVRGKRLFVWRAHWEPLDMSPGYRPGQIVDIRRDGTLLAAAAVGGVVLEQVSEAGESDRSAAEWADSLGLGPGEILGGGTSPEGESGPP